MKLVKLTRYEDDQPWAFRADLFASAIHEHSLCTRVVLTNGEARFVNESVQTVLQAIEAATGEAVTLTEMRPTPEFYAQTRATERDR